MKEPPAIADSFHEAIAGAIASDRYALAQDMIDVAAAAVGMKPSAVVGFGYELSDAARRIGAIARMAGMAVAECRPWRAACDVENLPPWYAEEVAAQYAHVRVLVFAPQPQALRTLSVPSQPLTALRESTALGYPKCCVDDYHKRRNAYHALNLRMLSHRAEGKEEEMKRLMRAGVTMTPRDDMEAAALMRVVRTEFAPCTSIAMCEACTATKDSPARQLSSRFRTFAEKTDLLRYLPAHE